MKSRGALLAIGCIAGCGGHEPAATTVVRDSAGIEIVENVVPADEVPVFRTLSEPVLSIGVADGDPHDQLFSVRGALRLDDGRIVIANGGTRELRFYDAQGRFLSSTGRRGAGPGEFQSLSSLRQARDSLYVYDGSLLRMSVFTRDGALARLIAIAESTPGLPLPLGVFGDGSLLVEAGQPPPAGVRMGLREISDAFYRLNGDGTVADSLGEFFVVEDFLRTENGNLQSVRHPFARLFVVATAGDGFVFGASAGPELTAHASDGRMRRRIRWRQPVRSVSADDIEREIQSHIPPGADANVRRRIETMLREQPPAETLPAYAALLVDAHDNLWVRRYAIADESNDWLVLSSGGRMLGDVVMPVRFTPFEIGDDFIVGVRMDELDVERVEMRKLVEPSAIH